MPMRATVPCFLLIIVLAGCGAHQSVGPQKPDAYYPYGQNEDLRKAGIIAYPLASECQEAVKPEPKTG